MQRFFVEPHQIDEEAHQIHITGSDVNHISNVLRMKTGEECLYPELRFSCMSAYCVDAAKMADACGMEYWLKDGRCAFFSEILF